MNQTNTFDNLSFCRFNAYFRVGAIALGLKSQATIPCPSGAIPGNEDNNSESDEHI
ncbi:hypothetical protein QUF80_01395 [Desulfococcaceae bacterium HSG8]|nr:hypothetical protein [Desulfococcaceae bacterium HSG8]